MTTASLRHLFEQVQAGQLTANDALVRWERDGCADLGYANVDLHRASRCGFPEVIYCEGKTCEWVEGVVRKLHEADQDCLATRVSDEQAVHLRKCFPDAVQDRVGRTFWRPSGEDRPKPAGSVSILTAGTADLPVAHEALTTAKAMGCRAELIADVGVAGIHRLLRNLDRFQNADAVVVAAGMEGALPSAVGGLVDCPVIAVPTSVGYGASFQGVAALLGMLNSCSANVAVVNIDSGFKGGYLAGLIAVRAARERSAQP